MIELGNYEDAIAVAPKVSLRYWQKCVDRYTESLKKQIDGRAGQTTTACGSDPVEELVNYSILGGQIDQAADILMKNNQI